MESCAKIMHGIYLLFLFELIEDRGEDICAVSVD
jgi:hypothetical protein